MKSDCERIKNIIENVVNKNVVKDLDKTSLITEGILDSLDIMNIITAFEDNFSIEIYTSDATAINFESIEAMNALVNKRLKEAYDNENL